MSTGENEKIRRDRHIGDAANESGSTARRD